MINFLLQDFYPAGSVDCRSAAGAAQCGDNVPGITGRVITGPAPMQDQLERDTPAPPPHSMAHSSGWPQALDEIRTSSGCECCLRFGWFGRFG